jgi:hypothetical protein
MSALRRYEMLLPQRFNDGSPVPRELFADVLLELRKRFGAVSCETQIIQGVWQHQDEIFHDDLVRVFADVPDSDENRDFFLQYKEQLKQRFQQLEIHLTAYPIEVL